jgi:dienelactone hydrolase
VNRLLAAALALCAFSCFLWPSSLPAQEVKPGEPLAGTERLTMEGDIAAQMVAGIDKFLLREIERSVGRREKHWKRDFSSPEAYNKSIEPNRQRLAKILGVVDERVPFDAPELIATTKQSALVGRGENYEIFAVRWPAVRDVNGEGLLLVPKGEKVADIIAIPDADQTPEELCGLVPGIAVEDMFPVRLAQIGCRVLVPTLISRQVEQRNNRAKLSNREFLYRPSFELGRHIIGYELQKVLAGVDWFAGETPDGDPKIGIVGHGEGGMLALFAAALDTRVDCTCVSGYFGSCEDIWKQPVERNVFGYLEQFGDAELMSLIVADRHLVVDNGMTLEVAIIGEGGGAPGQLGRPSRELSDASNRCRAIFRGKLPISDTSFVRAERGRDGTQICCGAGVVRMVSNLGLLADIPPRAVLPDDVGPLREVDFRKARENRQLAEIDRDTQLLLAESPYVREKFMAKLAATKSVEEYERVAAEYREIFAKDVIGRFDNPLLEPNPRSRQTYDTEKWTGYEVVLDVFPDVLAYGILCLPKDLKPGEKRPVVVCQHGLEGRPQDTIGEQGSQYYSAFAGKLAERGFITFAPQNIYIGKDDFRTLQRKANPLGKTLFSIMVPQHQQICNWLKSQPFVDGERIGFYGLSYGGKSAMRIPPLVPDYCLSICSADFNDWVDKNASTRAPYSYVWTGEYEIFEWDLGSTFNYAEMAALIAPRPFMVERGHFDGVGVDERVASEYAKVQRIYNVQLGMPDRCAIEWFVGPHKINGVGTFAFLHKHLKWPEPKAE